MKGILKFAFTELKLILRERSFYFWAIVLPVAFVYIFSGLGNGNTVKSTGPEVLIVNRDTGSCSTALIAHLRKEHVTLAFDTSREKVQREFIIPPDFTEKVRDKEKATLQFRIGGATLDEAAVQVKVSLYRAIYKYLINKYTGIEDPREVLTIHTTWAGRESYIPSGVIHQMPATILTFLLFNLLIFGGTNLTKLRDRGMLKRFATTPAGKKGLWAGLFLTNMLVALLVIVIIMVSSILLFSASFGLVPLLYLILLLLVFATFVASLSIYMGSVLKKPEAVTGVSVLVANVLAALGGTWWPVEIVPDFMKKIAMLLPTGWAMAASDKLLFYKFPFSSILLHLIVLTGFTLIFAFLSIRYFRIEKV